MNFIGAIGFSYASVYFWKISKDATYYFMIAFICYCICCICVFWLPESPRYLVQKGELDKARNVFEQIARWNGVEFTWDASCFSSALNVGKFSFISDKRVETNLETSKLDDGKKIDER